MWPLTMHVLIEHTGTEVVRPIGDTVSPLVEATFLGSFFPNFGEFLPVWQTFTGEIQFCFFEASQLCGSVDLAVGPLTELPF